MTEKKKLQIKTKAITELFNSKELHNKLPFIFDKHRLPTGANIQDDVIQVTFENLWKYDTDKFIEAYQNNPKRILALAVTICLRKCIYKDNRTKAFWNHSIAQQIVNQSTLNTLQHIDSCNEESRDNFNLPQTGTDNYNDEDDNYSENMWQFVRNKLSVDEVEILNQCFEFNIKFKGQKKKDYLNLLPKLKEIIEEFKLNNPII